MELNNENIEQELRWCVYMHINKINNKTYIGITENIQKRWGVDGKKYLEKRQDGSFVQPAFAKALLKYDNWECDWEHIVFKENLTQAEAKHIEMLLIALFKTNCSRYQNPTYGYNLTDGGDGTLGWAPTDETREKMRESHIGKQLSEEQKQLLSEMREGEKNPFYGKKHSNETRQKMSNSGKGKPKTEEFKELMSEQMSGVNNPMAKFPVYCLNTHEIFWGAKSGHSKYPSACASNITACCRGKQKYCGIHPVTGEKLHWYYVEDQITKDGSIILGAISLGYITQSDVDEFWLSTYKKYLTN